MCSFDHSLALQYISILASWPVVAIVILLLLNWFYGSEIRRFIDRIRKGRLFGSEFEADPQEIVKPPEEELQLPEENNTAIELSVDDLPEHLQTDAEALIVANYMAAHPVESMIYVKQLQQELFFERIYAVAYGSQLRLLSYLASRPQPAHPSVIEGFLSDHVKAGGAAKNFEDYIKWLSAQGLLTKKSGGLLGGAGYVITAIGVQFLDYVQARYGEGFAGRWL